MPVTSDAYDSNAYNSNAYNSYDSNAYDSGARDSGAYATNAHAGDEKLLSPPDRTLSALGFAEVPALQPLTYPGRPVTEPALLAEGSLLRLRVAERPLGDWLVRDTGSGGRPPSLDQLLASLGHPATARRHPVLAVGSNASPAQVHHKLTGRGLPALVPMVPVEVGGIAVGCSGHIGRCGYVAGAPYADPAARTLLVLSWLDSVQLKAVDDTEFPNYRRVLLPGTDFPMRLPSGEPLPGAYLYVSARGVLTDRPGGTPLPGGGDQRALLSGLLAASPALRELLGPDPESWTRLARAEPAVRAAATRIFADHGWVRPTGDLLSYAPPPATAVR